MNVLEKEFQLQVLNKIYEYGPAVNMEINVWYPSDECLDYLFSLENFKFRPNTDSICNLRSNVKTDGFDTISITIFRGNKVEYLQKKIKQREEVNK